MQEPQVRGSLQGAADPEAEVLVLPLVATRALTTANDEGRAPYYLRVVPKGRAPGDQHRTAPNAHPTAPWPMGLGWGASGDNLSATFMPRLCVYGR